jgi:hypothetical protein
VRRSPDVKGQNHLNDGVVAHSERCEEDVASFEMISERKSGSLKASWPIEMERATMLGLTARAVDLLVGMLALGATTSNDICDRKRLAKHMMQPRTSPLEVRPCLQ